MSSQGLPLTTKNPKEAQRPNRITKSQPELLCIGLPSARISQMYSCLVQVHWKILAGAKTPPQRTPSGQLGKGVGVGVLARTPTPTHMSSSGSGYSLSLETVRESFTFVLFEYCCRTPDWQSSPVQLLIGKSGRLYIRVVGCLSRSQQF